MPNVTPAELNEIFAECIYWLGIGAQMHIKGALLGAFRTQVETAFTTQLDKVVNPPAGNALPPPGMPRWVGVDPNFGTGDPGKAGIKTFILRACWTIGRLAARNAQSRGSIVIELADLKSAYNAVSKLRTGGPGEWCPLWA